MFAFIRNFFSRLDDGEDIEDLHFLNAAGTGTRCGVHGALTTRPFVTCRDCLRLMVEDERGY